MLNYYKFKNLAESKSDANPFDVDRLKESLPDTMRAKSPAVTALPTEFKTQNNEVDDEDW